MATTPIMSKMQRSSSDPQHRPEPTTDTTDPSSKGEKRTETPVTESSSQSEGPVDEPVQAEIEITGPLDRIIGYFEDGNSQGADRDELNEVTKDMRILVETIREKNGAIRSELAKDAGLEMDEEYVRHMLELLRQYGFVGLDQNTWILGPKLTGTRSGSGEQSRQTAD